MTKWFQCKGSGCKELVTDRKKHILQKHRNFYDLIMRYGNLTPYSGKVYSRHILTRFFVEI